MTLVVLLLLGLLIGAVLGGLGGGGAILTVPALVYVVGQSASDATTSSLVIVGATAGFGVLPYLKSRRVRWGTGLTFGIVGLPAAWLGTLLNRRVDENVLLLAFSVLMVVAALAMIGVITPGSDDDEDDADSSDSDDQAGARKPSRLAIAATALAVGLLTGFFGVGGGFVVVPALVLVLRLPIQLAVGTSLVIVALNSATSLAARIGAANFDWGVIVPFTLAAMVATFLGKRVADRLPATQLKQGFAFLLILVAAYTAWQSATGLL
ncbi:sulfite exporter TauE/SafE family protein [Nocardioides salsibiostraticola]